MNYTKDRWKIILGVAVFSFFLAGSVLAADFFIEPNFDILQRAQTSAVLVKTSPTLYFYIDETWWNSQLKTKQNQILEELEELSLEFNSKIYPSLTSIFGSEWKPGVDGEEKITLLFLPMSSNEGGYFRTADEYVKLQLPNSNEREMLYLSVELFNDQKLKAVLAHEFTHLITFNQKNKILGVDEDVWLNEARADYTSTILGYDDDYQGSNLQSRVKSFIENPSDSVTEWKNSKYDYASNSLFMHYMVDHYGIVVLSDSLKSERSGIDSINYALSEAGYKEKFAEIFTDWTIALAVNDCSLGLKYCYLNKNLKNFKITPQLNFLPISGDVSLSVNSATKNWAGNWQKFFGGNGDLTLRFSSLSGLDFVVPYVVEGKASKLSVEFLLVDSGGKGEISILNFGSDYKSIIIIPSLQNKFSGFDGLEITYPFSYTVSIKSKNSTGEQALIQQLLAQIENLKAQIDEIKAKLGIGNNQTSCSDFNSNLYFGYSSSSVKCLQEFLKSQGAGIYPEGLVTGYFGSLTRAAVIKFQEKHASEILTPINLYVGTGFVGSSTRAKINQLLQE